MTEKRIQWLAAVGVLAVLGLGALWLRSGPRGGASRQATTDGTPVANIDPVGPPPSASEEIGALGKSLYEKQCSACHGVDGKGGGQAAWLLYPKPRDFVSARYRLVSTWEGLPTNADIFRTISRGMPGSAMPSWSHLTEKQRWALVGHIKSFSERPLDVEPTPGEARSGVVQVPPAPAFTEATKARAAELFAKGCAPCHGATGQGDGVQVQVDAEGYVTRPRDLTAGVFKGSPSPEHVYRRILLGLPGTPMPSSAYLAENEAWALTQFVLAMSSDRQRERVEMKKLVIPAARVQALPQHPDDGIWQQARPLNLHLMPLWWRAQRPEELTVQALHDGKELALVLTWFDETHDHTTTRPQDFRDAAAVQLALDPDPPFFAMGQAGHFVNIWMWKSERQADLEPAFQDIDKAYPNIGIDSYPNLTRSALEQPVRNALTLQSDPTFVTGWGAGNIVSDPLRTSPAEDLVAQGFGTLSARPKPDQAVEANGVYSTGTYRVVFRRSFTAKGKGGVTLRAGTVVPVAFAVWNGSAGDRDGKKSVTIWQDLRLEP